MIVEISGVSKHARLNIVLSNFLAGDFKEGRDRCDCLNASLELVGHAGHGLIQVSTYLEDCFVLFILN